MNNSLSNLQQLFSKGEITRSQYIEQMYVFHGTLFAYSRQLQESPISQIRITCEDVIFDLKNGIKLTIMPGDRYALPLGFFNFGPYYEEKQWDIALSTVATPKVIFDIGANVGYFSLYSLKKNSDTEIFCFEPAPITYKFLEKNIKINNAYNIHPYNLGLSDSSSEKILYFNPDYSASSSQQNLLEMENTYKTTCQFTTVDEFVHKNSIQQIDFIKCDVEGAEKFVLLGAKQTLQRHRPAVFAEMLRKWSAKFGYHPNEIIHFMKDIDYSCFAISANGLVPLSVMTDEVEETNFMFLPNHKHK